MRRLLPLVAFAVLSALLVGSLWVVPYLPTNDGPEWVFASHMENHYADPGAPYPLQYVPALQFAAKGFTVLYDPLEAWLGWQRGLQVALSLSVLFVAWGFVALVRAIDARRWALGFLGFPLALSWDFYMGFWAFVVATGLGFFVLAIAVRFPAPSARIRALLSLLLFLQAVAHVFTAVLTGGALLCLALAHAPRGRRLIEMGWLAIVGLPAAGILVASVRAGGRATTVAFMRGFGRLPLRDAIAILPQTLAPGPLARALLLSVAVVGAVVIAVARARRRETDPSDRAFGVAAAILLGAAVLTPQDIPGWQFFSQRFLPLGASLAFLVLPLERLRPATARIVRPALFVAAATWLAFSYPFHRRLAALSADAIEGLFAPVSRTVEQLPLTLAIAEDRTFDPLRAEVPLGLPLIHMGALYAAAHGGIVPYVFSSSPATYPFVNREDTVLVQPAPDLGVLWSALTSGKLAADLRFRYALEDEAAVFGAHYEGIVLLAAQPDDFALWRRRGYATDWSRGSAMMAHLDPCGIDFTVAATDVEPPATLDVRVGGTDLFAGKHFPSRIESDGLTHVAIARVPCGDVAVRARFSGAARGNDGAGFCANADVDGYVGGVVSRTSNVIACAAP